MQATIEYLSAKAIFTKGLASSTFEGDEMAAVYTALNPAVMPPNSYKVSGLLPDVYAEYYRKVKAILDHQPWLNVVFDGSDDIAKNRLFNVSIQVPGSVAFYWITVDTGDERQTAENTVEILKPILLDLTGNDLSRINSVVTDTNSTMRKTQRLLGNEAALGHLFLSLCDSHGL